MKFTVVWSPAAENELTDLWLAAGDRGGITQAARSIDARLESNPSDEGESRPKGGRILFEVPLGVLFEVAMAKRRVTVVHVWHFRTP
jgi:plasmid stabilization system protein ParE